MGQQDVFDAILGVDEEFLPDGWDGKTDIITDDGQLNESAFGSDGSQAEEQPPEENEDVADVNEDAPTTDDPVEEQPVQNADEETPDVPADGQEQEEVKPSRKLKLKVNHKEEEIDINALSDADLITLLQKGRAFDAMKDAENKRKYREAYQEQLDAGMTEQVAKIIAQSVAEGKVYTLSDDEEPEANTVEPETPVIPARDFAAEVAQVKALYPDFKETPDEVALAVSKGVPLLSAYMAYRNKQSTKTVEALKKENAVLKQNAASAAKAPVKGVTGGGDATPRKKDPFEEGFDDADNW